MEIKVTQENARVPVTVFEMKGDFSGEEPLASQVQEAYEGGMRYLLLDLSKVPYISSAGLRAIHQVYNLLRGPVTEQDEQEMRQGIISGSYSSPNLKLLKPSDNNYQGRLVAGYDMFLEIYKKRADAIASY